MGELIRVGLYTRVSTDMQAFRDEGSLDTQEARLRASVLSRGGRHEVRAVFREEGQSGKSMERPELQKLLASVRAGELDLVMVTRLDRLSRSLLDFYVINQTFQEHGVDFHSLNEYFDSSTPMGRMMLKVILVFAEWEREQTAERTRVAMQARAERGLWNGGRPPLGYDSDGSGHLSINEADAELVRLIFRRYIEVRSVNVVANWLNEQGYRTPRYESRRRGPKGGAAFSYAMVRQILCSPLYRGRIPFKDQVFDGQHPALIDEDLWQRAQDIMSGNVKHRRGPQLRAHHEYLLTGLARCACGYAMTTSAGTGRNKLYFYYRCVGIQKKPDHTCTLKQMSAEKLEGAVLSLVRRAAGEPSLLEVAVAEAQRLLWEQLAPLREQVTTLQREQTRVEAEGQKLLETIMTAGLASSSLARERLAEAEKRREQLREALAKAEAALVGQEVMPVELAPIQAAVQGFDTAFDGLSGAERRELLGLMVHQVTVHPDRVEVDLYDGRHAIAWLTTVHGVPGPVHTENDDREQAPEAEKPRTAEERFVAGREWLPVLDLNQGHPD